MSEPTSQSPKLQWKWVGISFASYILFYILPICIVGGFIRPRAISHAESIFLGIWTTGGILVIAAIAAYVSEGNTLWEPVLAGVGLVLSVFAALLIFVWPKWFLPHAIKPVIATMAVVFILSLIGAGIGELAQIVFRRKNPDSM